VGRGDGVSVLTALLSTLYSAVIAPAVTLWLLFVSIQCMQDNC
jgi:hypothetical protein